jgi:hypothetical protein
VVPTHCIGPSKIGTPCPLCGKVRALLKWPQLAECWRHYFNSHAKINTKSSKPNPKLLHATHPDGSRRGRSITAP